MEDAELRAKFETLEKEVHAAYEAAEKARRYLLWIMIATFVAFVLPLLGLIFAVPQFLSLYGSIANLQ